MNNRKLTESIKRYLTNVMLALFSVNPYEREISSLEEKQEKIIANVETLQAQYNATLDKWDESIKTAERLRAELEKKKGEIDGLQKLVETLRQRIEEKDTAMKQQRDVLRERMEHMKADYQQRIDKYIELCGEKPGGQPDGNTPGVVERKKNKRKRKSNGHRTGNKKTQEES